MFQDPELEVLLPVHNEADIIELVTREIYGEISPNVAMQFIVCEDGSTDNIKEVLARLEDELPMKVIIGTERKGYSDQQGKTEDAFARNRSQVSARR